MRWQQAINFLTHKHIFFILSEKPVKPHSTILLDNIAHCPLPPLWSLKCRILPLEIHFKPKIPALSVFPLYTCVEQHLQQLPIGISIVLIKAKFNWICVFKLDYQAKKTKQK